MKWWTLVYVFDMHKTTGHYGRMPVCLARLVTSMARHLDYWTTQEGC